MSSLYSSWKIS